MYQIAARGLLFDSRSWEKNIGPIGRCFKRDFLPDLYRSMSRCMICHISNACCSLQTVPIAQSYH